MFLFAGVSNHAAIIYIGENTIVGENERTLVSCYQYFVEGLRSIILRTNVLLLRQTHQLLRGFPPPVIGDFVSLAYVRHVRALTVKDLDPTYILFHLINIAAQP